mgnify:CR=1 FL=1
MVGKAENFVHSREKRQQIKARKEEKSSLCGVLMVLVAIAVGVAGIVYALSTHRRHVNQEKWKDYDECGLV